jgi:hypothetical protein
MAPPQPVACRILDCVFILIFCTANYKRSARPDSRFNLNRVASVAAMQEWARRWCYVVALRTSFLERSYVYIRRKFQSVSKMQYSYVGGAEILKREEAMQW